MKTVLCDSPKWVGAFKSDVVRWSWIVVLKYWCMVQIHNSEKTCCNETNVSHLWFC